MVAILGPGMIAMWLVSGLVVYAIRGSSVWIALLIGAIVTPTDPVIANTIVTGDAAEEHIPQRLRDFLSAESGANDGGAHPFVFLAIFMLTLPLETALTDWFVQALLWEVGGAVALGAAIGAPVGWLSALRARGTGFRTKRPHSPSPLRSRS